MAYWSQLGQFQIEDDTSIDRQLHLLEVRVKVLLSQSKFIT